MSSNAPLTVKDIFQQLGLVEWWAPDRITWPFGSPGEYGNDYGLGKFGVPVGSVTSGRVIYVGDGGYANSSIGQIVQVLNSDGSLVHYQHLRSANVKVGQNIAVGDIVGTGGGCPVGAYPPGDVGQGCTRYDQYSTGQHIEVRFSYKYNPNGGVWLQNWIDGAGIFQALAGASTVDYAMGNTPTPGTGQAGASAGQANGIASLLGNVESAFRHIGLFLIALILIGGGLYMLFKPQIDAAVTGVAKTGAKLALA